MGDRLLHRRLREWADGNPDPMLKKCLHAHLAGSDLCKAHPSCTRCERAQAAALADEIERDYVPRAESRRREREIIEAQAGSARHVMRIWAERHGVPMRDGEGISEWLARCKAPGAAAGCPDASGGDLERMREEGR